MNDGKSEHFAITVAVLALVVLACAGLYLYTENPADRPNVSLPTASEIPGLLQGIGMREMPQAIQTEHKADLTPAGPAENRQKHLDHGGDWGIVSSDLVDAGMVNAADARVLNEATIRFAGSAAQATAVRTDE